MSLEGREKTITEMADKLSAVAFGDTIEQNREQGKPTGATRNPDGPRQILPESLVFDEVHTATGDTDVDMPIEIESDDCKDDETSKQRAIWDVIEPSEANLNKLDGWSPKSSISSASGREGSPVPIIDTSSVSDLENWLKENLPDDYAADNVDQEKNERRKSRVRWADVESRLQGLGVTLQTGLESSTGGSAEI